ncbi:transposase [Bradyrhizobium sp. 147]|uniref:IS66-like element accessory protein TnpA n=1 Tax=Bradyrhizobium sp. 147 TaxID=2782623 RepID=UPI001FF94E18|nr:transposase [Bradyrhizobium sp. 147]MCK1680518.1 transposase [Bradyrhizobium sp. 147]
MLDHTLKSDVSASRLEVITETGRRRWFSKDDKARIVEETLAPGAVVSDVARRHGLTPQQVFTWRRQARQVPTVRADELQFVPAVVDTPTVAVAAERKARRCKAKPDSGSIEIEIDGVTIRAGAGADAAMIAAIVHALKAPR